MQELRKKIIEYWHSAPTSARVSRYDRMIWVRTQINYKYNGFTPKQVWLIIEETTLPYEKKM